LFSPILGALSDRFGRRPVVLLSNFGLALDYVLMALAPSLTWLFIGRVISGITSASISTAFAYIADVTPPERRAAVFGKIGAAFGAGFILGPAVGGLLGGMDPRLPFWIAAGLSFANALYGWLILPESLPRDRRAPFHWKSASPIGALHLLRSNRILAGLSLANFFGQVAHVVLPSTFVLYATYRYGWDTTTVGFTLALVGVSAMVVQGAGVGPIVKRLGERRALLAGLASGALGFFIYGAAPTGLLFWLGYRRKLIEYARLPRLSGKSGWTLKKKVKYLFDSLFAFSDLPIRLLAFFGVLGLVTSAVLSIVVLIAKLLGQVAVPGYAATVLILTFFSGLNSFGLGVIGSYVWRTFENTKGRPLAIVLTAEEFAGASLGLEAPARRPQPEVS